MKKLIILINGILASLCILAITACSGNSSRLTAEQEAAAEHYADEKIGKDSGEPNGYDAVVAAQGFIRDEFAPNAEFEREGLIIEPTAVHNRYKILQKFTAENHTSGYTIFIYRIWVQYFDDGTWEYGNLAVESITGENVLTTNGNMKDRERSNSVGDNVTAGGIDFKVAEAKSTAIRIYTSSKLSTDQMRNAIKDLMDKYDMIQFATDAKHERGDEYACWSNGLFCNFDTNEVISKEKFLK